MKDETKNISNTTNEKETDNIKTEKSKNSAIKKKRKKSFLRVAVLVLLLCIAVFAAVIISDMVSKNQTEEESDNAEPPFITIQISADEIYLDGKEVSFAQLRTQLDELNASGEFPDVSIITDTGKPPHTAVYNQVAELLGEYGIDDIVRMNPASPDEIGADSTQDEV